MLIYAYDWEKRFSFVQFAIFISIGTIFSNPIFELGNSGVNLFELNKFHEK